MSRKEKGVSGFDNLTEAAKRGHGLAQFDLAEIYFERGDHEQAKDWYQKALESEHPTAQEKLSQLEGIPSEKK